MIDGKADVLRPKGRKSAAVCSAACEQLGLLVLELGLGERTTVA
jgi:hypothetical protein